jgi:alpha-galactosidase
MKSYNHSIKFKKLIILTLFLFYDLSFIITPAEAQKSPDIAKTPPMGWNSWNCFKANIDEVKIKSIADAMVHSGMKDAGYQYIVIDDGWVTRNRDANGHVIVDSLKFPHGIKALADYIHSLGLKFGIYSAPGCFTCLKLMGSLGWEQTDADDYASWGVDFLKYDHCNYPKTPVEAKLVPLDSCRAAYQLMLKCLNNTGRKIVFSVHDKCTPGAVVNNAASLPWIKTVANMHRTSNDIRNSWESMISNLETTSDLWEYAGPGYWNDPDMLEVGNTSNENATRSASMRTMNLTEYRTHFSMWCMVAAPLITGNDLRSMTPEIIEVLTNKELIAIDQDPLGRQGRRIRDDGDPEVWKKELSDNKVAVALLNKSNNPLDISVSCVELGVSGKLKIRDLWAHSDLGDFTNSFTGKNIPAHGTMVILLQELQKP